MSDPRRYVMIGGGPAGLASAVWLAEAGKQVTLLERRGQLGRPVDPDGPTERILLAATEELVRLHLVDPVEYPDELVLRYLRSLVDWAMRVEAPADEQ